MDNTAFSQKNQQQGDLRSLAVVGAPDPGFLREQKPGPGLVPLSKAHISPHYGRAIYWIGGSKVKFSKPKLQLKSKHKYGYRGDITKFTKQSRRRLLGKLAEVRKETLPYFMTLTYSKEYPDPAGAKADFEKLIKRLKRRFPKIGLVWKLEPQERSAPHFHCLVWGMPSYCFDLVTLVAKNWHEIAGHGDPNHYLFALGALPKSEPCITKVRSWRGVMSYASKYLGKEIDGQGWDKPGRFWGVKYKESIPWAEVISTAITFGGAVNLIRALRRYTHIKSRNYWSLTGFVDNPAFWREKQYQLIYGSEP